MTIIKGIYEVELSAKTLKTIVNLSTFTKDNEIKNFVSFFECEGRNFILNPTRIRIFRIEYNGNGTISFYDEKTKLLDVRTIRDILWKSELVEKANTCSICDKAIDLESELCETCAIKENTHCGGCGQYPENCEC